MYRLVIFNSLATLKDVIVIADKINANNLPLIGWISDLVPEIKGKQDKMHSAAVSWHRCAQEVHHDERDAQTNRADHDPAKDSVCSGGASHRVLHDRRWQSDNGKRVLV
jgi:hypothetical protein